MVKVGDRVVVTSRHKYAGTEFTVSKFEDEWDIVEGHDDDGGLINVPLHWVEKVR